MSGTTRPRTGSGTASGTRSRVVWPLVVLVGLLVLGAVGGVVWEALWTAPSGVAFQGDFVLDGTGARTAFGGTGLFVLVSAVVGILAGVVVGWVTRRDELLVMATALVGAAGATVLMYVVGHLLGPADPAPLAAAAEDYAPLRGELELAGRSPWLVLTGALLIGLVVTLLGFGRRPAGSEEASGHGPDAGVPGHRGDHLDWRGGPVGPAAPWAGDPVGSGPPPDPRATPPGGR